MEYLLVDFDDRRHIFVSANDDGAIDEAKKIARRGGKIGDWIPRCGDMDRALGRPVGLWNEPSPSERSAGLWCLSSRVRTYYCNEGEGEIEMCRAAERALGLPLYAVECAHWSYMVPAGRRLVGWCSVRTGDPMSALHVKV